MTAYSLLEIETIFKNCMSWDDIHRACEAFLLVIEDKEIGIINRMHLSRQANKRFREIENLPS